MKLHHLLLFSLLLSIIPTSAFASVCDEEVLFVDTVVVINGHQLHIQSVDQVEYDSLCSIYTKSYEDIQSISDIVEIENLLGPNYTMKYSEYGLLEEFSLLDKFTLVIEEREGGFHYYPNERIMAYDGGHDGDKYFYVDSGDKAGDPYNSAMSDSGKYYVFADYMGGDDMDYYFQVYDSNEQKYITLFNFEDVANPLLTCRGYHFIKKFFIGDTFYFSSFVFPHCCLTILD